MAAYPPRCCPVGITSGCISAEVSSALPSSHTSLTAHSRAPPWLWAKAGSRLCLASVSNSRAPSGQGQVVMSGSDDLQIVTFLPLLLTVFLRCRQSGDWCRMGPQEILHGRPILYLWRGHRCCLQSVINQWVPPVCIRIFKICRIMASV